MTKQQDSDENQFIKPAYQKTEFKSQAELQEFMKCADQKSGYMYFLKNHFWIQHPTKGAMVFQPFDYQEGLAKNMHENRLSCNLLSRQLGKTTVAAGYLLWTAMFMTDQKILISAHKYSGAKEIMDRVKFAYENCPMYLKAGCVKYNEKSIDFDNGSRIWAETTTVNTGRGKSPSILYSDELGFVKPSIEQDLWSSLTPAISRGGKLIITSTPNGDQNLFAKIWQGANNCIDEFGNPTNVGINGFKAYKALWNQHPEQDEKWGQQMRQTVGEEIFKREFDCEFISAEETLINAQTLQNLKEVEPIERQGQIRWYKPINKDSIYVVSLDPSLGTGSDPSAIQIIEANTTTQVGEWKHNKTPVQGQIRLMVEILFHIASKLKDPMNQLYYSIENNTVGEAALVTIANYGEHNIPGIFLSETGKKRKGFNTSHKSKLVACSKMKHLIESGKLKIHSQALISELKNFVASGGSYAAKSGTTDDLVMSLLLAIRMIQQIGSYSSELEKQMQDYDDIIAPLPIFMSFR